MADRRGANAIRDRVLFLRRAAYFVVVRPASLGRRALQCARDRMEGPTSV